MGWVNVTSPSFKSITESHSLSYEINSELETLDIFWLSFEMPYCITLGYSTPQVLLREASVDLIL